MQHFGDCLFFVCFTQMYIHLRIGNGDPVFIKRLFHIFQQPIV